MSLLRDISPPASPGTLSVSARGAQCQGGIGIWDLPPVSPESSSSHSYGVPHHHPLGVGAGEVNLHKLPPVILGVKLSHSVPLRRKRE